MQDKKIQLTDLITSVDPEQIDDVLKTISKYEKIIDKVSAFIDKMDKIGVITAGIRFVEKREGVKLTDPIIDRLMIKAVSEPHYTLFALLNTLPPEIIIQMHDQIIYNKVKGELKEAKGTRQKVQGEALSPEP